MSRNNDLDDNKFMMSPEQINQKDDQEKGIKELMMAQANATAGFRTAESNIEGLNQSLFERFFEVMDRSEANQKFEDFQRVKMKILFSIYHYR